MEFDEVIEEEIDPFLYLESQEVSYDDYYADIIHDEMKMEGVI